MVMKSYIFWNIIPCSPLRVNRHFGGKCRLRLQGIRISKHEIAGRQNAECRTWYFSNSVLSTQATNININNNTANKSIMLEILLPLYKMLMPFCHFPLLRSNIHIRTSFSNIIHLVSCLWQEKKFYTLISDT
jgi:hypothetical protein